jgi:Putative beta-barrel porin-2, OmpL-like. bbp2
MSAVHDDPDIRESAIHRTRLILGCLWAFTLGTMTVRSEEPLLTLPPLRVSWDTPGDKSDAAKSEAPKVDEPKKDDEKKDEKKDDEPNKDPGPMRLIEGDLCGWKIYGFVYGTAIANTTNGGNRYNGPWNINDQDGAYLNQAYLTLEKTMGDTFALGGRVDAVFGNDYLGLQSRGWELHRNEVITSASERLNTGADYGVTVPQIYAEVGTSKMSVLVGHFYTPLGYEVAPATGNFFNTHTYAFNFVPYTQWGAQTKWNPDEHWAFTAAVVNGWDSLDREQNSPGFVGGFKYTGCEKKWSLSYNAIIGDDADYRTFPGTAPGVFVTAGYELRYTHSLILDMNLSDRLEWVVEQTFANQAGAGGGMSACWYGVNNEVFWKLSDCWKLGARAEWFRDNNGFIVAGVRDGNPNGGFYQGNFYDLGVGANWSPNKNVTIRPEVRYDWFNGTGMPFNAGNGRDQLIFAIGAVVQF